jgi:hypothetical protein
LCKASLRKASVRKGEFASARLRNAARLQRRHGRVRLVVSGVRVGKPPTARRATPGARNYGCGVSETYLSRRRDTITGMGSR